MKIDLFKNIPVFKNILEKDDNNREINIYKTKKCMFNRSFNILSKYPFENR